MRIAQAKGGVRLGTRLGKRVKNEKGIGAAKIETAGDLADLYTKCHAVPAREKLQPEMEHIANERAKQTGMLCLVRGRAELSPLG